MLSQVRRTMETLKTATAGQLAAEIGTDRESVEAALAFWMHRNQVREFGMAVSSCGGCTACGVWPKTERTLDEECFSGIPVKAYEWVGAAPAEG